MIPGAGRIFCAQHTQRIVNLGIVRIFYASNNNPKEIDSNGDHCTVEEYRSSHSIKL